MPGSAESEIDLDDGAGGLAELFVDDWTVGVEGAIGERAACGVILAVEVGVLGGQGGLVGVEQEAFEEREGSRAPIAGGTVFGGEFRGVGGVGLELAGALEFGGGSVAIAERGVGAGEFGVEDGVVGGDGVFVVRAVEADKLGGLGFDDGRGALQKAEGAARVAVVAIPGGGVDVWLGLGVEGREGIEDGEGAIGLALDGGQRPGAIAG